MDASFPNTIHMTIRTIVLTAVALLFPWHAVHALGPISKLTVTPSSLNLTADQTVALDVTATDTSNVSENVTGSVTFTTTDPRGAFSGNTYNAGKAGSWNITVAYQGGTVTVPVTVTAGALAELSIVPDSAPEVVALDKTITFTAEGFDADNNKLSKPSITWSVVGSIGSVSSKGVFTPSKAGTGSVVAAVGDVSTTVQVKVVAARATASTNTSTKNTNTSNTNAGTDTNAPGAVNVNTNTSGTTDDTAAEPCSTRQNWLWGIALLALLGGIAILFAFVPISAGWPAITAIALAVILSVIERNYGCAENVWWPWIAILGTGGLTVFAYQQAPKSQN